MLFLMKFIVCLVKLVRMYGKKTMLLTDCPMIGLSATVNNGEALCNWIQNVENQRA